MNLNSLFPFDFSNALLIIKRYKETTPYPKFTFLSLVVFSLGIGFVISPVNGDMLFIPLTVFVGVSVILSVLIPETVSRGSFEREKLFARCLIVLLHSVGVGLVLLVLIGVSYTGVATGWVYDVVVAVVTVYYTLLWFVIVRNAVILIEDEYLKPL